MKRLHIHATFLTLFLCACVSPGDPMKKFVGEPASQLEAQLGQPNERFRDTHGGEIWNYVVRQPWGPLEQDSHVITGAYNTTDKSMTRNLSRPQVNKTV